MKHSLLIICLLAIGLNQSFAQISFTQTAKPIVKEDTVRYDSSVNFVGGNVKALLGQELYVTLKVPELREYGYHDFYDSYEKTKSGFGYIENYEPFAGKTFIVEEILPPYQPKNSYNQEDILKLKEKDSNNIYYYKYDSLRPKLFPFIILGFYEKEKTACIGKQIVLKKRNWRETIFKEDKPIYDFKTGLEVIIDINDIWTIQELTVEDQYYTLSYIISNSKGETLSVDYYSVNDYLRSTGPCALRYDDTLKKIKSQHPEYYKALMQGHVTVGMTEEMVRMAWGDPKEKRHASYGDFWYYKNDETLHFENGILSGFN